MWPANARQYTETVTCGGTNVRKFIAILTTLALLIVAAAPVAMAAERAPVQDGPFTRNGTYIVRLIEPPVVAYDGTIPGYQATRPAPGSRIDPNSSRVRGYAGFLAKRQSDTLSAVGASSSKVYSYVYSVNGFAANLTAAQANELKKKDGVVSVEEDRLLHLDTNRTPTMLGLDAANGLWNQLGGVKSAGENVIIGVIDSGIWPESKSFEDKTRNDRRGRGPSDYPMLRDWYGKCRPGEQFPPAMCNGKIIGAQWYNAGFGGDAAINKMFKSEYISARDADGHGTHTASTAGGNYGVSAIIDGQNLGTISGMAPRARIAVYKVCWGGDEGGCYGSDSVAAIDQAVADGVDVINFSISGTSDYYLDAVEVAFLFANDAGIFVAASAGNDGPDASTTNHPSPWLTTVAAGTKDDDYPGHVTLGNSAVYTGKSRTAGVGPAPLVYAGNVPAPGMSSDDAALCILGTLNPAAVAGKIVLCDRGVNARTDKSLEVKQAGGVGMILANTSPNSVNADMHWVPTIHVDDVARTAILAYINAGGSPTATITPDPSGLITDAPKVATFSSRGPSLAGGDILKPDIMAPGEDVLAAVSPTGDHGRNFDFLSGTSMASPHIAGIAALLTDAHPNWTPAMIQSAMMTTASQTMKNGNPIEGGAFDYGAGQVVPNSATDPGLVYNATFNDYYAFICGTGQLSCPAGAAIDPSDLNYPSISIGQLAGIQTVTRTVTNVGPAGTYTVSVDAPAGIGVQVSPTTLSIGRNKSATYTVTFTHVSAPMDEWTAGSLTWSDGSHRVRSPLVVRPVLVAAPAEVSGAGTSGSTSFDMIFGYTGPYVPGAHGMFAATHTDDVVVDDPDNDITIGLGPDKVGINVHEFTVPAGTLAARFSLFDDFVGGNSDLDLYVFSDPSLSLASLVDYSGNEASSEEVTLRNPDAGTYYVVVHGWETDGPSADYTLFSWMIPDDPTADDGSLQITSAPATVTVGQTGTVVVGWSGLDLNEKYLGAVSHNDGSGIHGFTLVSVDTD